MFSIFSRCIVLILIFFIYKNSATDPNNIIKLPDCSENFGFILVSTLDGKLTSLGSDGNQRWEIDLGSGPLLASSIHNIELTNNGEWVRIIPSLTGSLYKFNGKTIDAIPINADSLLKSSFMYSNELVIAGGRDVKTYGVLAKTGDILYECTSNGCVNKTNVAVGYEDIILIERRSTTVRAHEPRTGNERWNFSVGYHNISIPKTDCYNIDPSIDLNLTAIVPKGLLRASKQNSLEFLWQVKFDSPIVNIWKWNGKVLSHIDLFMQANPVQNSLSLPPAIYLAMYEKQLYIHESERMMISLSDKKFLQTQDGIIESKSIAWIPWKPISALRSDEEIDESTALSVLYSSGYVDGNGYYFYADMDKQCNNITIKGKFANYRQWYWCVWQKFSKPNMIWLNCRKELLLVTVTTLIVLRIFYYRTTHRNRTKSTSTISTQKTTTSYTSLEAPSSLETKSERSYSESSDVGFSSRFMKDFETVQCLGRGGYGVVFEAKQKIDECEYAIKRITLPQGKASERVLREVKALAKLNHHNIVRYCTSWLESPPPGFTYGFEDQLIDGTMSVETETKEKPMRHKKSNSTVISINDDVLTIENERILNIEDSFICFEDSKGPTESTKQSLDSYIVIKDSGTEISINSTKSLTSEKDSNSNDTVTSELTQFTNDGTPKQVNLTFLFIQMQLCQKESLKDWLTNRSERNNLDVLNIYNQILDAVEYIHSQKLIHRDLKPSNIFFSLEGVIKVGDFGLVTSMKNTEAESIDFSMRSHTKGAGTYFYMSPEQIAHKDYNYKVDIFSLGVIFFELLVAFATEMERNKTLTQLRTGEYPQKFAVNYPKQLALLQKMLSNQPDNRPDVKEVKSFINEESNTDDDNGPASLPVNIFI